MTSQRLAFVAASGSALLLAGALVFQAVGYAPCELCVLQRWPHLVAVLVGLLIWMAGFKRAFAVIGMLAALTTMAIAIYHSGVEYDFWQGPTHCSGSVQTLTQMSTEDLMAHLETAPVTRCDEVAWRFLTLSMATWNAILSAILAVIWGIAAFRR